MPGHRWRTSLGFSVALVLLSVSCTSPIDAAARGRSITFAVQVGKTGGSAIYVGQGLFLTAAHVMGAEKKAKLVQLGREWSANLVSADFETDIALLRIVGDVPSLAPASWAEDVPSGTAIFAVGFPAPLDESVPTITSGVVSGTRDIGGTRYLQIDAPVNPGNSGGPILTHQGQVAGMVIFRVQQSAGLNFAVPADIARAYVDQPVTRGSPPTPTPTPTSATGQREPDLFNLPKIPLQCSPGAISSEAAARGPSGFVRVCFRIAQAETVGGPAPNGFRLVILRSTTRPISQRDFMVVVPPFDANLAAMLQNPDALVGLWVEVYGEISNRPDFPPQMVVGRLEDSRLLGR